MFSVIVSAMFFANVFSPQLAQTTTRDVNISDSIQRFRDAQEEREEQRRQTVDQFHARLLQINDERKRNIVENLAARFNSVNEKWTSHWNNVLSRLSSILVKIEARAEDLDTSSANTAIERAHNVVNTQAAKTYEVQITDEDNLREEIQALISQFHEDLRTTHSAVDAARDAVQQVFRELKAQGGNDEN